MVCIEKGAPVRSCLHLLRQCRRDIGMAPVDLPASPQRFVECNDVQCNIPLDAGETVLGAGELLHGSQKPLIADKTVIILCNGNIEGTDGRFDSFSVFCLLRFG